MRSTVEIIRSTVETRCLDQLLRLSAEINCLDHLLRSDDEITKDFQSFERCGGGIERETLKNTSFLPQRVYSSHKMNSNRTTPNHSESEVA